MRIYIHILKSKLYFYQHSNSRKYRLEEASIWLQENIEPEEIILEKWSEAYEFRKNDIEKGSVEDYFKKYPCLGYEIGVKLVGRILYTLLIVVQIL